MCFIFLIRAELFTDWWLIERLVFSAQVKVFVTGLFSLNQDIPAFKEHLRDFLVQIKVSVQREMVNNCTESRPGKM